MTQRASVPPQIPGFRAVDLLGRGGFADVFAYEQLGLGRRVAVKVMLEGITPDSQRLFESEANVMAQLSNHPSIVSIYQAGAAADGRPFLVMEYCPPPHLAARLRQQPLSVSKALEVGVQIAGAAESAHRIGVLHRDIKPVNILFTEFGRPALTDFGISVTLHHDAGPAVNGLSVAWAPPEQIEGDQPMDASADVYSLAATIWATLAGHGPFIRRGERNDDGTVAQRVRTEPVPRTGRDDVPVELERVLATAMGKRPEQRFATAMELARALQQVQAQQRMSVTPVDVREEQRTTTEHLVEGGTRLSSFVVIDPDRPRPGRGGTGTGGSAGSATDRVSAPSGSASLPTGRAPGSDDVPWGVHDAGDTVVRRPAGEAGVAGDPQPPGSGGRRPGAVVAAALAVAALVAAAAVAIPRLAEQPPDPGSQSPDPTRSAQPQDPLGEVVPSPTDVRVRAKGGTAVVRWRNPDPQEGDTFLVQVQDVPAPPPEQVSGLRVVVAATPGRTCVEVSLVRSTGRASVTPAQACSAG